MMEAYILIRPGPSFCAEFPSMISGLDYAVARILNGGYWRKTNFDTAENVMMGRRMNHVEPDGKKTRKQVKSLSTSQFLYAGRFFLTLVLIHAHFFPPCILQLVELMYHPVFVSLCTMDLLQSRSKPGSQCERRISYNLIVHAYLSDYCTSSGKVHESFLRTCTASPDFPYGTSK